MLIRFSSFFFFNDTATTEIYTLSLHDALPILILTGEALSRENAKAIGELLAEMGGEFVCATAGHHMEAMLAAYGSGAAKRSHDEDSHILNIDVGGGTTKLALVAHGEVEATAAINIGGRLVVVD